MRPQPPNIILFLTDDQGAWAQGDFAGLRKSITPQLDALAQRGTSFLNAFTPSPVCSPARACLLTGRPPSWLGLHDWLQESDPLIADRDWLGGEPTLFTILKDAGWHTGLCGKWHLGRSHLPPRGCDWHFGLPGHQGRHEGEHRFTSQGQELRLTGNKTTHITDRAIEFVQQAPANQPFFLNIGYIATHSPYHTSAHDPARIRDLADGNFEHLGVFNPHPWAKNEGLPRGVIPTHDDLQDCRIGYASAVSEIDAAVGRVLDVLAEKGQLENTIVLYTSDHGCSLGQHGFLGKGNSTRPLNMHEASLRVPLILAGPRIEAQDARRQHVDHLDVFRTILDLLRILPPASDYPGASFAALLAGRATAWSERRYGEYGDLRMIRTPDWKYVHRYPNGPHDLFDLRADPEETCNLAADPALASLRTDLKRKLDDWFARHERPEQSGLRVKILPRHNPEEAWRDGLREQRGLQTA